MAKFTKQDLPDVEVQQSFSAPSVDTSRSELITNLGKGAGAVFDIYKVQQEKSVKESFQQETEQTGKVVATINEALEHSGKDASKTFDARTGTLNLIEGAPDDFNQRLAEVMKESGDEFRSIASAVAQGAIPKAAAALQLESKLREYTARYPAFSPELRATARDNAGYDPTGYHLKQILDITAKTPSTPKTYGQKIREEATAMHEVFSKMGGSPGVDMIEYKIAQADLLQRSDAIKASQIKGDQEAARGLIAESLTQSGPDTNVFYMAQAKALQENGGILNPEMQKASVRQAEATHRSYLLKLAHDAQDNSPETAKYIDDSLARIYKPMRELVDDSEYSKILERQNKTLMELDKRAGRAMFPELVMLKNSMSAEFAGKVLDHMMTFTDPRVAEQYRKNWPVLGQLIDNFSGNQKQLSDKMMNIYSKVATNQSLTDDDINWAKGMEPILTSSRAPAPVRKGYLETLGKENARGVGWLGQPGRRTEADQVDIEFMKREWAETVPALTENLAKKLVDEPNLFMEVNDEGKLQMYWKTRSGQGKAAVEGKRPVNSKEVNQLQYFLNAGKNGWAGDFGTTAEKMISDITSGISSKAEEIEASLPPAEPSSLDVLLKRFANEETDAEELKRLKTEIANENPLMIPFLESYEQRATKRRRVKDLEGSEK